MARTNTYQHFCPVARALEVIGEKWSLLIVRDLLRGPQRFSDLLRSLGAITPKWLTLRLRELEEAGIVEADRESGRREVWYRLTERGRDLAPVISDLAVWGIDHALRPPLPGEQIHPAHATTPFVGYLNRRRARLPEPVLWVVRFGNGRTYCIRFDGARWSIERGEAPGPADVVVEATPETWTRFLAGPLAERRRCLAEMRVEGDPDRVEELVTTLGRRERGREPAAETPGTGA
jgi:DNA-binding HxlR family transcriptional regulator